MGIKYVVNGWSKNFQQKTSKKKHLGEMHLIHPISGYSYSPKSSIFGVN